MAETLIDYPALLRGALLSVIRDVLARAAEAGFPGEHHAHITFRTDHPGVVLPTLLRHRYPEQMSVVLQHQFWELVVDEDSFSVMLRFSGKPVRLTVPFEAIQSFVDPAAEFGLRLEPERESSAQPNGQGEPAQRPQAEVVELDRFRSNRGD
jgi:hypothetical protein